MQTESGQNFRLAHRPQAGVPVLAEKILAEFDLFKSILLACRLAGCAPRNLCEIKPHAPSRAQRFD